MINGPFPCPFGYAVINLPDLVRTISGCPKYCRSVLGAFSISDKLSSDSWYIGILLVIEIFLFTVINISSRYPPALFSTIIFAVPLFNAVTIPCSFTEATCELLEVYVIVLSSLSLIKLV